MSSAQRRLCGVVARSAKVAHSWSNASKRAPRKSDGWSARRTAFLRTHTTGSVSWCCAEVGHHQGAMQQHRRSVLSVQWCVSIQLFLNLATLSPVGHVPIRQRRAVTYFDWNLSIQTCRESVFHEAKWRISTECPKQRRPNRAIRCSRLTLFYSDTYFACWLPSAKASAP
jgi:hypothetical protein